ncbi:MAG: copper chaperone PCu(A)C [Gammaproteobacteria bacterium]|nr:copper chaperone PCu(A)C [Gammaproteobacteria bacterium]MCW8987872.1 copper chaperone PCu(A)C [Gammaproteobacteria bacterium]MCW9031138.1 copper chaperone PCu(A)C [Gammaproteobacteria bacterium]
MASHNMYNLVNTAMSILALTLISITSYAAGSVSVMNPYARAVAEGHPNSAAFMVLNNTSSQDRALVKASSSISNVVELHTHKKEGGMMRMRQVEKIVVKTKSQTVLKPGGLHIMFIGLKQQLTVGNNIDLALEFDNGEIVKVSVPVKEVAGMGMMKMRKQQ